MGKEATWGDTTSCMHVSDGSFCTTSTVGLEIMLNLPPLDVFPQGEAGATDVRLKAQGIWAARDRRRDYSSTWDAVVGGCPVLGSVTDITTAVFW